MRWGGEEGGAKESKRREKEEKGRKRKEEEPWDLIAEINSLATSSPSMACWASTAKIMRSATLVISKAGEGGGNE